MLTKTWIGSWTTTSLQLRPAPRTPASAHSSATWTCTVVASQDPCMGEAPSPPPQWGMGNNLRGFRPLKLPVLFPCLPPALASGCPHHGPTLSTLVVPCSCSPCRALAQTSTCGSATSMAGRKASESDPTAYGLLACPTWATLLARTFGSGRAALCSTHRCILGLRAPDKTDGFTWNWVPLLLKRAHCFLAPSLEGEEAGPSEASSTSSVILVPGEPLL